MPRQLAHRKITSFAPDLDPVTPGIILDGNDFVPTVKGMRTLPSRQIGSLPLPEPALGAAAITFTAPGLSGRQVIVAGTATTLNRIWADTLGPATPWGTQVGVYAGVPAIRRWRFAFYAFGGGNFVYAANGVQPLWTTTPVVLNLAPTAAWFPVAGAPLASIVAASDFSLFVIQPQSAIWWSTVNPTIWTPAIETETVTGELTQTPDIITAAKALRSLMVLYKANATYIGALVGPPLIWTFTEASRQVGASCHECVVSVKDTHYFVGPDDFYTFDGFSVTAIPNAVREWFFDRVGSIGLQNILGRYDEVRSLVFWHYPSVHAPDQTVPDEWICVNVRTGQWSNGSLPIEVAVAGPFAFDVRNASGIIRLDHALAIYGANGNRTDPAFLLTGDIGERHFMYQLTRVRPGFTIVNGTPALRTLSTYTPGSPYVTGNLVALSADGWFNFLNTARLQRLRIEVDADVEIADLELTIDQVGEV